RALQQLRDFVVVGQEETASLVSELHQSRARIPKSLEFLLRWRWLGRIRVWRKGIGDQAARIDRMNHDGGAIGRVYQPLECLGHTHRRAAIVGKGTFEAIEVGMVVRVKESEIL